MNHHNSTAWTQNDDGIWQATFPDGALAHVWQDGRFYFEVFLTCGLNLTTEAGYMRLDTAQTAALEAWGTWKTGEKNA